MTRGFSADRSWKGPPVTAAPIRQPQTEAHEPSALLRGFAAVPVCVVGDVIYDAYLEGSAGRLSREGPVPVVAVRERREAAGGAANVAVNLAALGADVRLVSCVGDDEAGRRALDILVGHGVDVSAVVVTARRSTCAKRRVLADGQLLVRFDEAVDEPVRGDEEDAVATALARAAGEVSAVVVSDYGAGLVTDRLVRASADIPARLVIDAHDPRRFRRARPWLCTPSYAEAGPMLAPSVRGDRVAQVLASRGRVLRATGAEVAMVTVDREGVGVLDGMRAPRHVGVDVVDERCVTGAGDTFAAAATLALTAGADPVGAAHVGCAAAAVVVAKPGTATCSRAELRLRLGPAGKLVADVARLPAIGEQHRRAGRRIVFTNGCFDILHRGHVALLEEAKRCGDVLVVAVNDDDSVRRLKGSGRPVNALADRIEVLAALSCVDHIVPFSADRPVELIRALRPDVLVKGGDYTQESIPEAPLVRQLGGEVRIVELVPERSTTGIIERARVSASR